MFVTRRAALAGVTIGGALFGIAARRPLAPTPFQTMGPFYPLRRPADSDGDLTLLRGHAGRARGQVIEVIGRVLDRRGAPVPGAMLELWQANAAGRYDHPSDPNRAALDPGFQGYGVVRTDRRGGFRLLTVKPGAYPLGDGEVRAPHLHFQVSGRSDRLVTQMYFPGEPLNGPDQVRRRLDDPAIVTAARTGRSAAGLERLAWDIVLRSG